MNVEVKLFGLLRERAGSPTVVLELPEGAVVADALDKLASSGPLAEAIARVSVAMAVNREYADPQTVLAAEDELALIPPLSGGSR